MRKHRLLIPKGEGGSAPLETIFAIVLLMVLALGTIQVSLALYARNVVASSAHEGARAAIELGRDPESAEAVARRVVERSAGGLVHDLRVSTSIQRSGIDSTIHVRVTGSLEPLGPVPIRIPFTSTASVSRTAMP